ncbi:leucine/isoleucine/valine transporter permease subunit [Lacunisphaera limnophila]|uniref:Leucine/isoleucine/valine transporter permease subunit n=1 Tax=Lacunisphaera limnophila TaxID=1838286 RepID=A0A1D8AWI9_9BACT|nr:urea ABC transporter permease subunit UrtC [Lacunisphaera limnophila]AOS45251.1 leucine/isoleucine/valine transporter permease subunit [Lacunisphaera limnophila]
MSNPVPAPASWFARHRLELSVVTGVAVVMIVLFPLLHAYGVVSDFTIRLWGKYLCYALLAISVNLLWGSTGLLSLGQALFFTLGGYMHGMYLMRMIGDLGQYKKPIPDFLVFLGWERLPAFWEPFASFPFALTMVFVLPGVIAYIFGYLAFRSRIKGVYFSILTQALTYAASIMFFRNNLLLGGNNGFTDFKFILGYDLLASPTQRGLYIATAVTLLVVYLFCRWLSQTKFGLVQQAIRDGENRVLFSGYATAHYKLFIFVLAALIAAVGGALYVPQVGIINPGEMQADKSLEAVVWVAVGGRGTLLGPIVGAVSINALKSWATRAYPDLWLIILGGLFILVVLFLPGGLVSLPARLKAFWAKFQTPKGDAGAPTPVPNSKT